MSEYHDSKTMARLAAVKRFIGAITDAAVEDVQKGIPERHTSNTGQVLLQRLGLSRLRVCPRNGDGKYARSLYTAAYWLYQTETTQGEGTR